MTSLALDNDLGATLGKYEILRKLAVGGMAEIYLARARGTAGFEKLVVLKRILPNVADDPTFVQMFLDEARLAATLQHPNIADVFDVGSENTTYFFTMEYIHGEDARSIRIMARKREQPIPLANALAIVHGTASALDYAHNKIGPEGPLGLVHRDVSTSNILVSFDGAVKLVDFGIARATSRQSKTRTGTLKGKIPYMSPEQCQNRPLDRRSDLFSLGVVLYELTVGRRPFRGDSDFEILDQIINKGARPPSQIISNYPAELEHIVMRLLARPAAERYQTGEELLHELEQVMTARGAWVSPITLGRYMKSLFPDKVDAWNVAQQQGASLGEHVAQTITSESMRQEMRRTPVSAFSVQLEPPPDEPAPVTPMPSRQLPAVLPTMPARRGAWKWVAAGVVGAAIAVSVLLIRNGSDPTTPPMTTTGPSKVTPTTPSAETTPSTPAPARTSEPARLPASEPAAAAGTTTATPSPTTPSPAAAIPKPSPGRALTVKRPLPTATPKPTPKPDKPKPDPKEQPWDPNSMYLPK